MKTLVDMKILFQMNILVHSCSYECLSKRSNEGSYEHICSYGHVSSYENNSSYEHVRT